MSQAESQGQQTDSFWTPKTITAIVIAILAVVFVFLNTRSAKVQMFFWDINAPGWLWMLILFVGGVVVGSLFPWFRRRR